MATSYFQVELDPVWGPRSLAVIGLTLVQFMVINFSGGRYRKYFRKEEMEKKFGHHFEKRPEKSVPKGGYPDCGNGKHSDLLTYKEWYEFNLAQRTAKNYLESITLLTFALFVLTIVQPWYAFWHGLFNLVMRSLYTFFYNQSAKARVYAAPLLLFNQTIVLVEATYACYWWQT